MFGQTTASLDALSALKTGTLGDMIADDSDGFRRPRIRDLQKTLAKVLADLPARDREIIGIRFGFTDRRNHLPAIGEQLVFLPSVYARSSVTF